MEVNQAAVRGFFNALAGSWDAERAEDPVKIREILALAGIVSGVRVLDVACGTGVLFPYYLELGAASVLGVDLSPEMVRIAREKCTDARVRVLAGDAQALEETGFDRIVIFNALPHFPDPSRLIADMAAKLTPGGRLTVAHDRSRASINGWHEQTASEVSLGLPEADKVAGWMRPQLDVDVVLDGEDRFVVSGVLREE